MSKEEVKKPRITFMKGKYLTKECREEILRLHNQGLNASDITKEIFQLNSVPVCVRHIIHKAEKKRKLSDE